jgi:hypothetical protein
MNRTTPRLQSLITVGVIAIGATIALSSFGVVRAEHARTSGSCSSSGYCLSWENTGSGGAIEGRGTSGITGESSKGGVAVVARSDDTSTDIFSGLDSANGDYCTIDPRANLKCTGKITGKKALRVQHRSSEGQQVLTYASESASATIEDVGTARMFAGMANVAIDPSFASVMDRSSPYYVFLTPLGDTRGLYVSVKTPSGFQVRETQGGRSRLEFDYRIVARPLDAARDRLPIAPATRALPARPLR